MYFLCLLPAALLAVPLFALWRIWQIKIPEFCASSRSIFMIPAASYLEGSALPDVLEGDLRLAEAA
jgi:hypothetical protein